MMPWIPDDAMQHTRRADTPSRQKLWAKVANQTLAHATEKGFREPEAHAIRVANSVIDRTHKT